jgi:hypothetical protein
MPRPIKAKKKPSEKGVVVDDLVAILFVALNDTPSPNQRKNLRRVTVKSNVARTKTNSSIASPTSPEDTKNKSPVALPPSPEDSARKCPPEDLIEEDKQKQKATPFWSRGKPNKVVVVNLPKGKDTGPPSNKSGISFCSQCNGKCISLLFMLRKKCCETKRHVSLYKVGEYVVFPAKIIHCGFFSAVNKIIDTAQLFCGYSNSAELPRVKRSVTETIGTQTGTYCPRPLICKIQF